MTMANKGILYYFLLKVKLSIVLNTKQTPTIDSFQALVLKIFFESWSKLNRAVYNWHILIQDTANT